MKSRKELINEYKLKKFKVGVFQIRDTINNKVYVDSSVNLDAVWNRTSSELKLGGHKNVSMQMEWNEFGGENFKFEILSEIAQNESDQIILLKRQKFLQICLLTNSNHSETRVTTNRKSYFQSQK